MRIKASLKKNCLCSQKCLLGVNYLLEGGSWINFCLGGDTQTYGQGGHMSPVSAVQCSAVLQYSACQSCSRPVHQSPKKWKTEEEKSRKRKEGKSVSSQAKISNMLFVKNVFQPPEVCVLQRYGHTNKHTLRRTW